MQQYNMIEESNNLLRTKFEEQKKELNEKAALIAYVSLLVCDVNFGACRMSMVGRRASLYFLLIIHYGPYEQ
jgi:hypothetical protein